MWKLIATLIATLNAITPVLAEINVSNDRFRQIHTQSTPTSCGPASVATWMRRNGYKVSEGDLLASLENLRTLKRSLKEVVINERKNAERETTSQNKRFHAIRALRAINYPEKRIKEAIDAVANSEYIPEGLDTGISRFDLHWLASEIDSSRPVVWKSLNPSKLGAIKSPLEIQGIVLLPIEDHYILVEGFVQDIDGVKALIADPDPLNGGNLSIPLEQFILIADPEKKNQIPILTYASKSSKPNPETRGHLMADPPIYLPVQDWERRAIGDRYIRHENEDNESGTLSLPLAGAASTFIRFGPQTRIGIALRHQSSSLTLVGSTAFVVEGSDRLGWSGEFSIRNADDVDNLIVRASGTRSQNILSFEEQIDLQTTLSVIASLNNSQKRPLTVTVQMRADNYKLSNLQRSTGLSLTYGHQRDGEISISYMNVMPGTKRLSINYERAW